jgi:hypothetical protein
MRTQDAEVEATHVQTLCVHWGREYSFPTCRWRVAYVHSGKAHPEAGSFLPHVTSAPLCSNHEFCKPTNAENYRIINVNVVY